MLGFHARYSQIWCYASQGNFTPPGRAGNVWCELIERDGRFWLQSAPLSHLIQTILYVKTLVISRKNLM